MTDHGRQRSLFGVYYQQSHASLFIIEKILSRYKPDAIIELGTASGILSRYFCMYVLLHPGSTFRTTDLKKNEQLNQFIVDLKISDRAFVDNLDIYDTKTVKKYTDILNNSSRPLLFVDGKDPKSDEINLYVPLLNSGTVILAHDFITSNNDQFKWGFKESDVCWDRLSRHQPYWDLSIAYNTRLFCVLVN